MRLVVIESPLAGDVDLNTRYVRACMLDCLERGEAPFASHALYPQVLDDLKPDERTRGILAGFAWAERADARVVYQDLGISEGMSLGIQHAQRLGQVIEHRWLGSWQ